MLDLETITERLCRERMRAIDELLGMMWSMATGIGYTRDEVRALLAVHNMRGGERFYLAWAGARIGPVYSAGIDDEGGRFRYVVEPVGQ
jgi:hypothetical protein